MRDWGSANFLPGKSFLGTQGRLVPRRPIDTNICRCSSALCLGVAQLASGPSGSSAAWTCRADPWVWRVFITTAQLWSLSKKQPYSNTVHGCVPIKLDLHKQAASLQSQRANSNSLFFFFKSMKQRSEVLWWGWGWLLHMAENSRKWETAT